tara:strand:- start:190 stop:963 length:774 start_codon:yes stop_codon:yes gene_type:complete
MSIKFTLLGCGSSMGVPRPDGFWGKCNFNEKKNYRTRCSALISTNNENTLIDTSPDLRYQLIKQKINKINRVLYSHMHADQTHGINDLRIFFLKQNKKIDVYANKKTKKYLFSSFSYCFKKNQGYPPILKLNSIKNKLIFKDKKSKLIIKSISVKHGPIECLSFIINNKLAYASDVNQIYKKDLYHFKNLKYFVVDCLRFLKHPSHFNLDEVLKLVDLLKPKKTILTNLHSDLDYNYLLKILPKNVIPAHDGLSLNL